MKKVVEIFTENICEKLSRTWNSEGFNWKIIQINGRHWRELGFLRIHSWGSRQTYSPGTLDKLEARLWLSHSTNRPAIKDKGRAWENSYGSYTIWTGVSCLLSLGCSLLTSKWPPANKINRPLTLLMAQAVCIQKSPLCPPESPVNVCISKSCVIMPKPLEFSYINP